MNKRFLLCCVLASTLLLSACSPIVPSSHSSIDSPQETQEQRWGDAPHINKAKAPDAETVVAVPAPFGYGWDQVYNSDWGDNEWVLYALTTQEELTEYLTRASEFSASGETGWFVVPEPIDGYRIKYFPATQAAIYISSCQANLPTKTLVRYEDQYVKQSYRFLAQVSHIYEDGVLLLSTDENNDGLFFDGGIYAKDCRSYDTTKILLGDTLVVYGDYVGVSKDNLVCMRFYYADILDVDASNNQSVPTPAPAPAPNAAPSSSTPHSAPTPLLMPNLVGKNYQDAVVILGNMGLSVPVPSYMAHDEIPANHVISHTPLGGTRLSPGDVVDLVVSTGPSEPLEQVPLFIGQTEEWARNKIALHNLTIGTIIPVWSAEVSAGIIVDQSIAAYTEVPP